MLKIGLLGRKLSHSYSPQIHKKLADYEYKLYEKEPNEIKEFVEFGTLDGMNVTIPYKKDVIPFCNRLSETAQKIGSVNTLVRESDKSISGYNTDYFGFSYMIEKSGIDIKNKKCLILGSGGASLTVDAVLKDFSASEIIVISRSGENNYDNLEKHFDADVIVNTTPVGMFPNVNSKPVDLKIFKSCSGVLDLIYNPEETLLLKQAQALNIPKINGLVMLVAQAKQSCELFQNIKIDDSVIDKIVKEVVI